MRRILIVPALAAIQSLSACVTDDYGGRGGYGRPGFSNRDRDLDRRDGRRHDGRHVARERRQLGKKDRIYRDRDGRYFCQRRDGSRGAMVGALAGSVLGNIIAPGDCKTLGTILGAGGCAFAGRAIDRRNVRCE
ncbi:hypothetical protein [Sphingobium sp. YR768]|uniref:hypothetical protein n=1 Tax=Sphingobium sp. YR768 TaxID=1884365 RepID=UPI000B8A1D0F|nr:hypothetical protein [Sphingobium sp. YR768]